ncbi:host specificity factor TipJ family phage tail protein [Serratia nevei]|uniref:host specificity factor TipJ family phage tail protein n=1 Tax=Serratia nevei TaxID=2703794 RepID=UPI00313EC437
MPLIIHYTRNENGGFNTAQCYAEPMVFVTERIPDGVPFTIYRDSVGEDNNVTEDFDALRQPGTFHIIEGAGGGVVSGAFKLLGAVLSPIMKLLTPSTAAAQTFSNVQGESPNNSLTDRNNKPRPYERVYDICGTVQSIPNNLMTTYRIYNASGREVEYGYYCVGRGLLDIHAADVTDGDTVLQNIPGSSAYIYGPNTSPNSGVPQLAIGDPIDQGLYITVSSNEVDGQTLKAPNDLSSRMTDGATAVYTGGQGIITDPSGGADFTAYITVGDSVVFKNVFVDGVADLNAIYTVTDISTVSITVDPSPKLSQWVNVGGAPQPLKISDNPTIEPYDTKEASFTPWTSITRIKPERLLINVSAPNGMYLDWGAGKLFLATDFEAEYQLLDDNDNPYGPVYSQQATVSGRSGDEVGTTLYAVLPVASKVRVRVRRVTPFQFDYDGVVVDELKYNDLFAQIADQTPHYGNITTVHTARLQTARATAVKQPQLKIVCTEMVQKYLGAGQFDPAWTPNTQAVQSLIRLLRDPVVGGLDLTAANMDALIATQAEIESYFGNVLAGQFCYTFDTYTTTAQDIIEAIAEAVFCRAYREGKSILLDFDRPRPGPEMVFTHRSKIPGQEKWTRSFNDQSSFDSVKFSYIDPDTNTKETITIPPDGGAKTDTYDSKGVRNYQQAYWLAHRRYQMTKLKRVSVDFSATEEGALVRPGRAISVVKGARVAPYDGYVVAADGLTLTLSQPVDFSGFGDHSLILKKRNGSVQSVPVVPGTNSRKVVMLAAPQEAVYTGNSALKTEFSFGNDSRHGAQMIMVQTVVPNDDRTVKITGFNYHPDYYLYDGVAPFGRAFSEGFDSGFS